MRSAEGVPGTHASHGEMSRRSIRETPMLLMAAAAQAAVAVGLGVAVILNVVDSVSGDAWTTSNAIAFIVLEAIVAVGVALVASGIARVRPWSRTPAVMTQLFTILIALWLLEAHRYGWGIPALLVAIAALAGLFAPTSLRALSRPGG
ncbi:MAG TPA: hypothetical protein VHT26_17595 [Trebonia sp.]|nr:hypothetical protein [Trebonia sp.]